VHVLVGADRSILFSFESMQMFKLCDTDVTIVHKTATSRNLLFAVSPGGDFVITIDDATSEPDLPSFTVTHVDGAIDATQFAKKLLHSSSPLSVTDAWTFLRHLALDTATLRTFISLLVLQASEAVGKGSSNFGALCKILHFLGRFVPKLAGGVHLFYCLNDLDRTVSMLTTMTGKQERVVQVVDDILSKGAICLFDTADTTDATDTGSHVFILPDQQLDTLIPLLPLVKMHLCKIDAFINSNTNSRLLLALSSFRRRLVSIIAFGLAMHKHLNDSLSHFDGAVVAEVEAVTRDCTYDQDKLQALATTLIRSDALRSLSQALSLYRASKKMSEHELSVSVLCMLLTGEPLFPEVIALVDQYVPAFPGTDSALQVVDMVRGVSMYQGIPTVQCRVCLNRTMRFDVSSSAPAGSGAFKSPRLFHARWNEHYQGRCVCGGEYAAN
jgi:hypothetical protein